MFKILQKVGRFLRRMEPSKECPLCGYLMHSGSCDVCGGNPENVVQRGSDVMIICHKCGGIVDGLDGPFSCKCR